MFFLAPQKRASEIFDQHKSGFCVDKSRLKTLVFIEWQVSDAVQRLWIIPVVKEEHLGQDTSSSYFLHEYCPCSPAFYLGVYNFPSLLPSLSSSTVNFPQLPIVPL